MRLDTTPSSPEEVRLAAIWSDLLAQTPIGLDDNFFDLGGHSILIAKLQQRIATEFGILIPALELFRRPTVRQQTELTRLFGKDDSVLPGVVTLQANGTRTAIFWMNHLCDNLAKAIGKDQPFFSVALTKKDLESLGRGATLPNIAACHSRKILATQMKGPYMIGGLCVFATLAYEIAWQLEAAGHEVSLLVLLDPSNPSSFQWRYYIPDKWENLCYILRRVIRLGPRKSVATLLERLRYRFAGATSLQVAKTDMRLAHEMIEAAVYSYHPKTYEGRALLLVASDRSSNVNLVPAWQALIPKVHIQRIHGHHNDLAREPLVQSVADAILSYLAITIDEKSSTCRAHSLESTDSGGSGEAQLCPANQDAVAGLVE